MENPVTEGESSGKPSGSPSPFDLQTIKYLVRLMGRHDLTEIDLREGELRIRLRRGPTGPAHTEPASIPIIVPTMPTQANAVAAPAAAPPPPSKPDSASAKPLIEIKSPTPGTFYSAASPDTEPYVKVGSRVEPDTVVCIIEAMKVFNEITAECSGTIVALQAENGQPVEYGQVLFKVDPAA